MFVFGRGHVRLGRGNMRQKRGHVRQVRGNVRQDAAIWVKHTAKCARKRPTAATGIFTPLKSFYPPPPLKNDVCSYVAFKGGVKTLLMGGKLF